MVGARRNRSLNSTAPTPTVPNPFKELRLEDPTKPSIEALAKRMGLSKQALIRLEQAVYNDPLPTAINWFADHYGVSEHSLLQQYEDYQKAVRELYPRLFGDIRAYLHSASEANFQVHPLTVLRGRLTVTEVSKRLCTPQSSLVYWERNVAQQQSIPTHFIRVLREVGHYKSEVDALIDYYDAYRNAYLGHSHANS